MQWRRGCSTTSVVVAPEVVERIVARLTEGPWRGAIGRVAHDLHLTPREVQDAVSGPRGVSVTAPERGTGAAVRAQPGAGPAHHPPLPRVGTRTTEKGRAGSFWRQVWEAVEDTETAAVRDFFGAGG